MENLYIALNAVAPLFLMVGVGCVVRRRKIISDTAVRQANSLCFRVFMSIMLFHNICGSDLHSAINGKLLLFTSLGVLAEFFIGIPFIIRVEPNPRARGVMLQAFFRTNVVLLGVSMAASVFGEEHIAEITVMSAVVVPEVNVLGIVALELFQGEKPDYRHMFADVVKNPLVIGAALGILVAATGLKLPEIVLSATGGIGRATTPMALVLLGASLDFSKFGGAMRNTLICVAERLVIAPGLAVALAVALGIRGVPLMGVLLCFATPVAVASFTVASEMGGDTDLAGAIVLLTTGLSCVTLFLWIWFLKTVGLM